MIKKFKKNDGTEVIVEIPVVKQMRETSIDNKEMIWDKMTGPIKTFDGVNVHYNKKENRWHLETGEEIFPVDESKLRRE